MFAALCRYNGGPIQDPCKQVTDPCRLPNSRSPSAGSSAASGDTSRFGVVNDDDDEREVLVLSKADALAAMRDSTDWEVAAVPAGMPPVPPSGFIVDNQTGNVYFYA